MPRTTSLTDLLRREWLAGTSIENIYSMVRERSNAPYWDVGYINWICTTGQRGRWENWNTAEALNTRNANLGNPVSPVSPFDPCITPIAEPKIARHERRERFFNNKRTFGVEIEFLRPSDVSRADVVRKIREFGVKAVDESHNHSVRSYWKYITDCSVHGEGNLIGENEINSPVLKGKKGLEQVRKVCEALTALGCKINNSCGLHVHHGIADGNDDYNTIANVFKIYSKYQKDFDAMLPLSRRNNRFALPIDSETIDEFDNHYNMSNIQGGRYHVVNLQSYWKYGTLEFRQHSGSVEAEKIINWIMITQRIVNLAASIKSLPTAEQLPDALKLTDELKNYYSNRCQHFAQAA